MRATEAVGTVFSKYAMFRGRATRSEYWWFFLFDCVAMTAAVVLDLWFLMQAANGGIVELNHLNPLNMFTIYYAVITLIPRFAVTIRRLHDAGLSGFLILTLLIPAIGWMVLQVLMMLPSEKDDNIHGPMTQKPPKYHVPGDKTGTTSRDPMQGYALLMQNDEKVSPEMRAAREEARKAEVRKLYEERVLGAKPAQ